MCGGKRLSGFESRVDDRVLSDNGDLAHILVSPARNFLELCQ
jgi:hypothetical protein